MKCYLKSNQIRHFFGFKETSDAMFLGSYVLALLGIEHMLNPSLMKIRKIVKLRMSNSAPKTFAGAKDNLYRNCGPPLH